MIAVKTVAGVKKVIDAQKRRGKSLGFVPTMGALHAGHLSLVKKARKDCDFVTVSIFINPTQFSPKEDYKKYPRTTKEDLRQLRKIGVDLVFCPEPEHLYLKGNSVMVYEHVLSQGLCGKSRPYHFAGVATIVAKLFNIITPDIAYFGQKDYQQAQIIKRLARDLNFSVKIEVLPIVRDRDGLALSSRNRYLNDRARIDAAAIYEALRHTQGVYRRGERSVKTLLRQARAIIAKKNRLKIDYIKIIDPDTLREVKKINGNVVLILAVYVGKIRLIDNVSLTSKGVR